MKDERIQTTANKFAAIGYFVCYSLTSIALCCRVLILKQHIRNFWDMFAIFCIGTAFVFIAYANKGLFAHQLKRFWLTIFILVFVVNFMVFVLVGQIHSVGDVGEYVIGAVPGMGLVIAIAYFLNRRWKRKEGLENDK